MRAIGGVPENDDRVNTEIHYKGMMESVWGYTWRPRSSELRDALGGDEELKLEMQLEAMIEQVRRCTGMS